MSKNLKFGFVALIYLTLLYACSTEKNTGVNRAFHYVNARFNGHFNANELLNVSLFDYRANLNEDFYKLIPLEAIPSEQDVEGLYPAIDTAISKVKIVIADHSMPSNDKPSKKNAEHNNYIDENWITIGKAYYYRRDYETALKSFKFINKYFDNDPSNYIGELWMAKTYLRLGDHTNAKLCLDRLEKSQAGADAANAKSSGKSSSSKSKKSKADKLNSKGKQGNKEKEVAKFPKSILFEFARTKADLALVKKDYAKAIEELNNALDEAKKTEDKGRMNYAIAQLYEQEKQEDMAIMHYKKVRKYKVPYQMSFNASLKASVLEGGPKIKKSLNKMLRDAKNAEYKDQIYYTLGLIELRENREDIAMVNFTNAAFYSTKNTRQKGMAYEKMGDLRYAKRDYVRAQKYYDSCGMVVDDLYPNVIEIRSKAAKLADLVLAVETVTYEDSLQRIAKMDPDSQEKFLKDLIKKQKEEALAKAQRDAEKLRELAKNNSASLQDMGGKGGGYWSSQKQMNDGAIEFVKVWGQRSNEDHWRRSDKAMSINPISDESDTLVADGSSASGSSGSGASKNDGPTVDELQSKLPKSDEDFALSNQKIVESLYKAGVIYKEQLKEPDLAKSQFSSILDRQFESEYNMMAAFQLYKLYENADLAAAGEQREYILNNYPNSDYANYLRDPDYFVKKRDRDALAEQEYVTVLQRYNRKIYYPVIARGQQVMDNEPENAFRSKYMLLLAMSMGQTTDDKKELLPILERIVSEYENSEEAARAQDMIDIINNGYSKYEPVDFSNKSIYKYDSKASQIVLVFLGAKDNVDLSKTKISDFSKEFFPKGKLSVSTNLFDGNQTLVMVAEFPDENAAKEYVRTYKKTKKHLLSLMEAKVIIISRENIKLLFETKKMAEYEKFYNDYY